MATVTMPATAVKAIKVITSRYDPLLAQDEERLGVLPDRKDISGRVPFETPRITIPGLTFTMTATESRASDPRLAPFLDAPSEAHANDALEALLGGEMHRTICDVVRRQLGG